MLSESSGTPVEVRRIIFFSSFVFLLPSVFSCFPTDVISYCRGIGARPATAECVVAIS